MMGHTCEPNKKCQVREHRPTCVCKYGFSLSDTGELRCAPERLECRENNDCASNSACKNGLCTNPCNMAVCSNNRTCLTLDHRPVCVCTKDCNPSVFICLRDNGCPAHLACMNFQCVDPCLNASCPQDAPCFVEDHKPVCKFCPLGFIADHKYGCLKGKIKNLLHDIKKNKN